MLSFMEWNGLNVEEDHMMQLNSEHLHTANRFAKSILVTLLFRCSSNVDGRARLMQEALEEASAEIKDVHGSVSW